MPTLRLSASIQVALSPSRVFVPVTPVRGAGQAQGTFVMERLLDRIARELNLDRAEVTARNLIKPAQIPDTKPDKTRTGAPVIIDSGDYPSCQRLAIERSGWNEFRCCKEAALREGRYIGIGLANFVELTRRGLYEPDTVKINTSGKIYVCSSATAMGHGTKSMLAQIVAKQLGGDLANIDVSTGDTAKLCHRARLRARHKSNPGRGPSHGSRAMPRRGYC